MKISLGKLEPIRFLLYPLLVVLVGAAVLKGIVDDELASILLGVAAVVLGVPAVEVARSKVTPTAAIAGTIADEAVGAVRQAADDLHLGPESQRILSVLATEVENRVGRHRAR